MAGCLSSLKDDVDIGWSVSQGLCVYLNEVQPGQPSKRYCAEYNGTHLFSWLILIVFGFVINLRMYAVMSFLVSGFSKFFRT